MEKRNVTITLDEEVAGWVRVEAAKHQKSVSRYVSELLRERMGRDDGYQAAMEHFLSAPAWRPVRPGPLPTREEIHDRKVLRW